MNSLNLNSVAKWDLPYYRQPVQWWDCSKFMTTWHRSEFFTFSGHSLMRLTKWALLHVSAASPVPHHWSSRSTSCFFSTSSRVRPKWKMRNEDPVFDIDIGDERRDRTCVLSLNTCKIRTGIARKPRWYHRNSRFPWGRLDRIRR